MSKLHTVITRPVDTEKAAKQEAGKYTFIVRRDATKTEVAEAVERYYGVKVDSVRTCITHPKTRSAGRGKAVVKRPMQKKAIVKTVGAKTIDINKIKVAA